MLVVGLTGGIGCGKSTVRQFLERYPDTAAFDCDAIAKQILISDEFRPTIEDLFGAEVFSNQKLDLKRVAQIIFEDGVLKRCLERILHPLVRKEMMAAEARAERCGIKIFIIESAILFETDLDDLCDITVCTICPDEERYRRLVMIRLMTIGEIEARIAQQMPEAARRDRSNILIETDHRPLQLQQMVEGLHEYLLRVETLLTSC
jgi:dephospho-CoA kinase